MDIMKLAEKLMAMDDTAWARHANPWSVYTRFSALPLLSLAVWSREWWGLLSAVPITLSILWIWLNPRLMSPPRSTDNWASMGTFGERIYLNRRNDDIPAHHLKVCQLLLTLTTLGIPLLIYGLITLDLWIVILGNFWVTVFKAWFVDRMVWLYLDLKDANPRYHSWLKVE